MTLHLAQITDAHLLADPQGWLRGRQPLATFERTLAVVAAREPHALLLTGDLSDDGSREAYVALAERVRATALPTLAIAGNHDHPVRLAQYLADDPFHADADLNLGAWRLLALDSSDPPRIAGVLDPEQLRWLAQALDGDPRPTLVVLHHPPLAIGCPKMDPLALVNGAELRSLLDRFAQVRLCLFGHIHQPFEQRLGSVTYLGTPSCLRQFAPRPGETDAAVAPPGYRWLTLYPDGAWATQVVWLEAG